jgi:hypothetical protein
MTAFEWPYSYIVGWYPDGRWVAWFRRPRSGQWGWAASGRHTHLGTSEQIHRPALVQPPTEGDTAA